MYLIIVLVHYLTFPWCVSILATVCHGKPWQSQRQLWQSPRQPCHAMTCHGTPSRPTRTFMVLHGIFVGVPWHCHAMPRYFTTHFVMACRVRYIMTLPWHCHMALPRKRYVVITICHGMVEGNATGNSRLFIACSWHCNDSPRKCNGSAMILSWHTVTHHGNYMGCHGIFHDTPWQCQTARGEAMATSNGASWHCHDVP